MKSKTNHLIISTSLQDLRVIFASVRTEFRLLYLVSLLEEMVRTIRFRHMSGMVFLLTSLQITTQQLQVVEIEYIQTNLLTTMVLV